MKKIKTLFCLMAIACTSLFAAFLTGCNSLDQLKCKHEWSAVKVIEPSTCTEKGKGEKTCKLCEKVETVKLDFEHVPTVIEAIKPTCTEKGRTDYVVCYACEKVLVPYAELSPTGHKVVKDEAVAVTCLKNGLTEGEHCEICKVVLLEQKKIVATGHNIVYYPEQAPTCTEAGYTAGEVCKNCGAYDTREEIPELGHDYNSGSIGGNICANCGQGKAISLYDLKTRYNLYGYKLVLAENITEEEVYSVLRTLSDKGGHYIYDDNGADTTMLSIAINAGELEIYIYGEMVFHIQESEGDFSYTEIILNSDLGFTSYFVDEINCELSIEVRQKILSLFELVYVVE